jgi:hypothetical protein
MRGGAVQQMQEFVEVWTGATGEPDRLIWRGRRFRVSDMPTPLVGAAAAWWGFPAIVGWRFQATAEDGETHVFDVGYDGEHWRLLQLFD